MKDINAQVAGQEEKGQGRGLFHGAGVLVRITRQRMNAVSIWRKDPERLHLAYAKLHILFDINPQKVLTSHSNTHG
jgi:hypothetical protein